MAGGIGRTGFLALGALALLAPASVTLRVDAPAASPPAHVAEIRGVARVTDGDTLRVGAERIRLFGIDAPETGQRCGGWDCGAAATSRLADLVGGDTIRCAPRDRDQYGRLVAVCTARGVDLGGRLVAEGLARAYTRYGDAYAAAEADARTERLGLWRGAAEAPWEYRAAARRAERGYAPVSLKPTGTADPPAGCRIKGNVSAGGTRLYHLPGGGSYERTRIDPGRGEAWFCSEAEASAAGFRPAGR
jgi:endonuclease YncB( thermonuclease family)